MLRNELVFTSQNLNIKKIQRHIDISIITTNKTEEPVYNIIETINHNNKPIQSSNKTDTNINGLT